jgi:hypothetical protein
MLRYHHENYGDEWEITVDLDAYPRLAKARNKRTGYTVERAGESYDEAIENVKGEIDALLEAGS